VGFIVEAGPVEVGGWANDTFVWLAEEVTIAEIDPEERQTGDVERRLIGHQLDLHGAHVSVLLGRESKPGWPVAPLDFPHTTPFVALWSTAAGAATSQTDSVHIGFSGDFWAEGGVEMAAEGARRFIDDAALQGGTLRSFRAPKATPWAPILTASFDEHPEAGLSNDGTVVYARCAERSRAVLSVNWPGYPYVGTPVSAEVRAYPHPTRPWTAITLTVEPYFHFRVGRKAVRGGVLLIPSGPEVLLLGPPGADLLPLAAALAPEGVVTGIDVALAERERTVVYAAEGWADEAAAVAAKIPGGATVEPLTWSVPTACVVVALGAEAT
jgi:hypothetical protein